MNNDGLNNNEQKSTTIEESNTVTSKKHGKKAIKIILVIITTLLILFGFCFALFKSTIDVSDRNADKFDYILNSEDQNTYNLKDYLSYNSVEDKNIIKVALPKTYLYEKLININDINEKINSKYNLKINRFGILSNLTKKDTIDFSTDITYLDSLSAYISGSIKYEFTDDNSINLYLDDLVIGDGFPKFIYESIIPIKNGDLIKTISSKDIKLLKDGTFALEFIKDINISKDTVNCKYDFMSNIDVLIKKLNLGALNIFTDNIEEFIPIVLELAIGENKDLYQDFASQILPFINFDILN